MKHLFIWLMVFFIFSCSPNNDSSENGVEYSAFHPGRPSVWGSLDLAKQSERTGGTIEVSRYNGVQPTTEQKAAADQLYDKTLKNVIEKGWMDFKNAERDGYVNESAGGGHAINMQYMLDGEILNPEKPEVLVVTNTDEGLKVSGVMFWMDDLDEHGPQIGGHETRWHFHEFNDKEYCLEFSPMYLMYLLKNNFFSALKNLQWCDGRISTIKTPEMMHVWFVEHGNVGDRFSSSMSVGHRH